MRSALSMRLTKYVRIRMRLAAMWMWALHWLDSLRTGSFMKVVKTFSPMVQGAVTRVVTAVKGGASRVEGVDVPLQAVSPSSLSLEDQIEYLP